MKRILACTGFICLMFFLLFAFVSDAFPEQVVVNPIKSFNLTINSQQVTVKLPDALPDMETAVFRGEECFNLIVCRQQFGLGNDYVDFLFTDKTEVVALVWIKILENTNTYVVWKYVDGMPLSSTIKEIIDFIKDAEKPKESSFRLGPKPPPVLLVSEYPILPFFVDFTWEGELSPDEFTEWKVIKTELDVPRGIMWVYWQNPDSNAPVKVVAGEVYIDGTLVMYRYFKYGVPYMFYLDNEKNKYVQYKFTEKEKRSCMKCHKDKVELPSRVLEAI